MGMVVAGPPEVDVEYPEGPSMPEGDAQARRRMELVLALRHWYAGRVAGAGAVEGAWVCCDVNVYYKQGDPKVVVAPDVAVAFGVDVAAVDCKSVYKVWEAGAAPCFVLEIASPTTLRSDLGVKPAKYAELGVREYWRLDPTGGELLSVPLQGETRRAGRWVPIEVTADSSGSLRGRSEVLGLDLCWAPPKLRLWDTAAGVWLPDPDDLADLAAAETTRAETEAIRARTAETRAETEAARARTAETRAEAAEAELERLRARLAGPESEVLGK